MEAKPTIETAAATKIPWNNEKMIGSRQPLRIKNVWSIRTNLPHTGAIEHPSGGCRSAWEGRPAAANP